MTAAEDRDPFPVNEDRALDALTLAWGDSCEIYLAGGQWQAWHDDAPDQDMLTGKHPPRAEPCHPHRLRPAHLPRCPGAGRSQRQARHRDSRAGKHRARIAADA